MSAFLLMSLLAISADPTLPVLAHPPVLVAPQTVAQVNYQQAQAFGCAAPATCGVNSSCCNTAGCYSCGGCGARGYCGCHGCGCGLLQNQCLPCPWCPAGNMPQHMAYLAEPKTYYYFRPYNYLHIEQHRVEAQAWNAERGLPYSNDVFDAVFAQFEAPGEILPSVDPLQPEPPVVPAIENP